MLGESLLAWLLTGVSRRGGPKRPPLHQLLDQRCTVAAVWFFFWRDYHRGRYLVGHPPDFGGKVPNGMWGTTVKGFASGFKMN